MSTSRQYESTLVVAVEPDLYDRPCRWEIVLLVTKTGTFRSRSRVLAVTFFSILSLLRHVTVPCGDGKFTPQLFLPPLLPLWHPTTKKFSKDKWEEVSAGGWPGVLDTPGTFHCVDWTVDIRDGRAVHNDEAKTFYN